MQFENTPLSFNSTPDQKSWLSKKLIPSIKKIVPIAQKVITIANKVAIVASVF
jgi:hypothetical protein